jgi:hypothetical protein
MRPGACSDDNHSTQLASHPDCDARWNGPVPDLEQIGERLRERVLAIVAGILLAWT